MDYEKKYKELIEKIELISHSALTVEQHQIIDTILGELKESEDERIRKELIKVFSNREKYLIDQSFGDITVSEALAWLEKQGEQKVADIVEPKFKVGDWLVNNISKDVFLIKSINNGYYTLEDTKGNIISPCLPPCESESHLWTIQDAKDGDVLATDDRPFIYNGNINPLSVGGYCGITYDGHFKNYEKPIGYSTDGWTMYDNDIHPATKEQSDLLFSKMKDAGYEWDADKKELKKIE